MAFNSIPFILFFSIIFLCYYGIPTRFRHYVLLVASYAFLFMIDIQAVIVVTMVIIAAYLFGYALYKKPKKSVLCIAIIVTAGLLLCKYGLFFITQANGLLSRIQSPLQFSTFSIVVPIGLSFYTLKAIGYLIDCYRNKETYESDFFRFALYISFFPQISSGPIEKAKNFIIQTKEQKKFSYDIVKLGMMNVFIGLLGKVILSDRLGIFVDAVFKDLSNAKGFTILIAMIFYSLQIYLDFASYSYMAIGFAKMFGYDTIKNFDRPYFSKSIKEFWRRWHISLSTWLKEYIYIPLGGNRKGRVRKYVNLVATFLVSGLWHGEGVHFLVWGGLHGIYQVIGDISLPVKNKLYTKLHINRETATFKGLQTITTFALVTFGWLIFRLPYLSDIKVAIRNLFTYNPWFFTDGSLYNYGLNRSNMELLIIGLGLLFWLEKKSFHCDLYKKFNEQPIIFRWFIYTLGIAALLLFGIYGPGYNAQSFIYQQF